MTNLDYASHLARLQEALLEGKIDRPTYEQLKADLDATRPAAGASERKFPPSNARRDVPTGSVPIGKATTGPESCFVADPTPPTSAAGATLVSKERALPGGRFRAALIGVLWRRATAGVLAGVALHVGLIAGFAARVAWRLDVQRCIAWGAAAAAVAAAVSFTWLAAVHAARLAGLNAARSATPRAVLAVLLGIGGLFCVSIGVGYGSLVGGLLAARLHVGSAAAGGGLGAILGLLKAWQAYANFNAQAAGADDATA